MNARAMFVRWGLLPALIIAAGFLAWWSYRATAKVELTGEQAIIRQTVTQTREKVTQVDRQIVDDDNHVIALVDADDLDTLVTRWLDAADHITPTIRSVMILDQAGRILRHVSRGGATQAAHYRQLFVRRIEPALHLEEEASGGHKHLHDTFDGETVMVSCLTRDVVGRRYFVVLESDLDYIRTFVLPHLFDDPAVRFNVVDETGHLIYGRAINGPADFTITRAFPTTLYKWRLSVSAQDAPQLPALAKRRRLLDAVLVGLSLAVLVAGVAFLAYAARNEQRLNRLKSDFIATVSHELKTPLSLIRMFGEMLATERVASDAKRKQYLDIIVRESERLTSLIENVLDFAKLERGKPAFEFHRGNLADVVRRGIEMFRYRLEHDRPRLVTEIADDVPEMDLDDRALQLLLFNLLDNAVKYAGDGEQITVRVRGSGSGRALALEVEDRGPGIAEDDRRRIFERFYRGHNAGSGGVRGSGIGLALVKNIANAHGGDVTVRNGSAGGALFEVLLPLRNPGANVDDSSRAQVAQD